MELEKLREIIGEVLNIDPDTITADTTFVDDLGADSLDLYQIKLGLEEAFGTTIPDEKVAGIKTVGEALALIKGESQNK